MLSPLHAVGCLLLVLPALQASRIVLHPVARRELRARPLVAIGAAAAGLALVAGALWLLLMRPLLAIAVATALLLASGAAWLRARPTFGRASGLPPGSLGLRSSLDAVVDPDFYLDQARLHGAVFKTAQIHNSVVCLVDLEEGRRVLRDHSAALRLAPLPISRAIPKGFLRYMSPDDYGHYSAILRRGMRRAEPLADSEATRELVRGVLRRLAAQDPAADNDPETAMRQLAVRASLPVLLGDRFDGDLAQIEEWLDHTEGSGLRGRPAASGIRALDRFHRELRVRSRSPTGGRQHDLWSAVLEAEPGSVDDRTLTGNLLMLLHACRESISGLALWLVTVLARDTALQERVRRVALASSEEGEALARAVVLETLRFHQSEYVYRRLTAPLEIGSYRIPTGWLLRICVQESHRDEAHFERPSAFEPDRHLGRPVVRPEFAPFGLDRHACLGARLTLAVCTRLAVELCRGWNVEVVVDGPPERGNRHWNHWRPSRRLRLSMEPRAASPQRLVS